MQLPSGKHCRNIAATLSTTSIGSPKRRLQQIALSRSPSHIRMRFMKEPTQQNLRDWLKDWFTQSSKLKGRLDSPALTLHFSEVTITQISSDRLALTGDNNLRFEISMSEVTLGWQGFGESKMAESSCVGVLILRLPNGISIDLSETLKQPVQRA